MTATAPQWGQRWRTRTSVGVAVIYVCTLLLLTACMHGGDDAASPTAAAPSERTPSAIATAVIDPVLREATWYLVSIHGNPLPDDTHGTLVLTGSG